MSIELGRVIAELLEGAGDGIEQLRDRGSGVALVDCTIDVMVDDASQPSARVRIVLGSAPDPSDRAE